MEYNIWVKKWLPPIVNGVFPIIPEGIKNGIAYDEDASDSCYHYIRKYVDNKWSEPVLMSLMEAVIDDTCLQPVPPEERVTDYTIVKHFDIEHFTKQIIKLVADGWTLQGGVAMAVDTNNNRYFAQALVFKE